MQSDCNPPKRNRGKISPKSIPMPNAIATIKLNCDGIAKPQWIAKIAPKSWVIHIRSPDLGDIQATHIAITIQLHNRSAIPSQFADCVRMAILTAIVTIKLNFNKIAKPRRIASGSKGLQKNPGKSTNCKQLSPIAPELASHRNAGTIFCNLDDWGGIADSRQSHHNPVSTRPRVASVDPELAIFFNPPQIAAQSTQNLRTPILIAINTIKLDRNEAAKLQNIAILLKGSHQSCMDCRPIAATSRTNDAIQVQFFTSLELTRLTIHTHIKDCTFLPVIATCLHCTASNCDSTNRISITDPCAIPAQSVRKNWRKDYRN